MAHVTAIVPCRNGEYSILETVEALINNELIDEVIVVDDGSKDQTSVVAYNAGARVVRLERNHGKAAAMLAGMEAASSADVLLFVDGDTRRTAGLAAALLPPVLNDEADLTVAVLPSAGGRGGFGVVKRLAQWGVLRSTGKSVQAPLSGQRAVNGDKMRALVAQNGLASRFGVEVGMTIDALNSGLRVNEIEVAMEHEHRGKSVSGFAHRGRQGKDVLKALWYRALPVQVRMIPLVLAVVVLLAISVVSAHHQQRDVGVALPHTPVVNVVLVPGATWSDPAWSVLPGPRASVVTGSVDNVINAVAAGSRDKKSVASDINIETSSEPPTSVDGPTIVMGFTAPKQPGRLRPIVFEGFDSNGTLASPSTKRSGLIDLTDIAPTILTMEGKAIPDTMTGTAMTLDANETSISVLEKEDKQAHFYDRLNPWVILAFVLVQVVAFMWAFYRGRRNQQLPAASAVGATIAAFPIATYFGRWVLGTHANVFAWLVATGVVTAVIAYVANHNVKDSLTPLRRILALTIAVISIDILTGGHLQVSGTFGSSPTLGARYHGLGNPASELLLLATVLWVGLHMQTSIRRTDSLCASAAMLFVVTVIVGLPGLGSDVGGLLTLVMTSIGLLVTLWKGRLPWKAFGGAVAAAVLAIIAAAFVDYQRSPDARTHLGRLMARVINEGPSPLFDVIGRKINANVLAYGFPWSLGVIAIVGFMLIGLLRGHWTGTFPLKSAQRIALIAALAASFVAYAVNDSGIVVLALVSVFVGPFVLVEYRLKRAHLEVVVP